MRNFIVQRTYFFFILMLSVFLTAGCGEWKSSGSDRPADGTAPVVSSTIPAAGAANVAINSAISATFSEAMDPSTITSATFRVTGPGTTPVDGEVSYSGTTAVFTPEGGLDYNVLYTATITTGAEDRAGNALANDHVWQFTTGMVPDDTRPRVIDTINAALATGVATDTRIGATFSEAMAPSTITGLTFTLTGPGMTPVDGDVTYSDLHALFIPDGDLDPNTTYTATITTGATDLAGNELAGNQAPLPMASDYVWSFTTGPDPDTTRPRVTDTINHNGATNVWIYTKIGATFSEAMDPLTINGLTFTVTGPGLTPVAGAVSYLGINAVFTPTRLLAYNTTYTVTITDGAMDLACNELAGNQAPLPAASDYVWRFTTGPAAAAADTTRPRVIDTINDDGAVNVPINTLIGATFSEAMNPLTITVLTFTVTGPGATPVAGAVSYLGVNAIFTPDSDLAYNTTYTATITNGATDLVGNQLAGNQAPLPAASDYVWSFTTGAAADLTAPLVTLTFPEDGDIDVPLNSLVTATFDEAMDPLTITTVTFTLTDGIIPVTGIVTYDLINYIATFNPDVDLDPSTTYTATITDEATDLAGNALLVPAIGLPPNPWTFTTGNGLAAGAVNLGRAGTFGIMATASTTSTGATMINGDVALNPGSSQGIPPVQVNGEIHVQDQVAIDAQTDLTAAYNFAWTQGVDVTMIPGNDQGADFPLGMAPGVYWSASTMLINTPLTLDAGGNVDAVWIFQIGSSLTTFVGSPGGNVLLANGAQAKNVFFVPVAAATIGAGTTFNGNILAGGDVTGQTLATINGRMLAGESGAGVIALDSNTVNVPAP